VHSIVARLQTDDLVHMALDQPVNEALETPLHVAARKGNASAAKALLAKGADPARRNLRGDTPAQLFMVPRCNGAARLSRGFLPARRMSSPQSVNVAVGDSGHPQPQPVFFSV